LGVQAAAVQRNLCMRQQRGESHAVAISTESEISIVVQNSGKQPELKENLRNGAMLALNENREKFLKKNGVACFSERNDNLLMWSHYGGQYKGLCLEFRTEHEPFNKLFPVKYVERMPQIRIDSILIDNDPST
jgi:hypothetical protein